MLGMAVDRDTDFVAQLGTAFVAHRLRRLAELFVEGNSRWLPEAGVTAPARSLSTLLLLAGVKDAGVTEIASRLRLSHPFMIKAVARLEEEGLVETSADSSDARRRPVRLTAKGRAEVDRIRQALRALEGAYRELFEETGFDLAEAVARTEDACLREPFDRRLRRAAQAIEKEEEMSCDAS